MRLVLTQVRQVAWTIYSSVKPRVATGLVTHSEEEKLARISICGVVVVVVVLLTVILLT